MLILDNVRNGVIHLVAEHKKDGGTKRGHSRQKFGPLTCKS